MTVHVNIGSNIGDRRALIERAVVAISELAHGPVRQSAFIESPPWGYESANAFLNVGVCFESDSYPEELLRQLLDIQNRIDPSAHRNADGTYADRAIDIDLIAVGSLVVDTDALTLPHPRMHLREFVLRPMVELDPAWRHPRLGATASELLAGLRDGYGPG